MPRRPFQVALAIVLGTVLVLGVAALIARREIYRYPDRVGPGSGKVVALDVPKGAKLPTIVKLLAAQGLIDRPLWFRVYAMHRGAANRMCAGHYELHDKITPRELLAALVPPPGARCAGLKAEDVQVTIPEGLHLREVAGILAAAGLGDAAALEATARAPEWLREQGIDGETAEGYLFPETYRLKKGLPPGKLLAELVKHHREVWAQLRKEHAKSADKLAKDLGWTDRELLIMASLVEKETGEGGERPKVASVFYNRLTKASFASHRLETDPTIRYGCTIPLEKSKGCQEWDPSDRLHRAQLDDADNRYNTYQHAGLPPGPIANPGRAAIAAALDPESTDYFFFVAKDGQTYFSKTLAEHERKVDKYIRGR